MEQERHVVCHVCIQICIPHAGYVESYLITIILSPAGQSEDFVVMTCDAMYLGRAIMYLDLRYYT